MAYCTNCGTEITSNSKFCPNCGAKTTVDSNKSKRRPPPKRKMQKGVVKSIQDETTNYVKSKVKETLKPKVPKEKLTTDNTAEAQNTISESKAAPSKKVKKWMLFYILFNIPLYFINTGDDEITGVLIFSAAVLVGYAIYALQKVKEKPYTIFLKIVLVLQSLLAVSGIMSYLEYIDSGGSSLIAVISLALLVILNIRIIFRRNK